MNLKFRTLALICLPMLMHWEAIAADPQSDEITVSSEYVFHVPSSMPENEAKATALTRAKLQAIEEHFGSTVIQNNSTTINTNSDNSDVKFTSIAESEIKGEWVKTIGEPEFIIEYAGGLIITVRVKGIIRPITNAECDIAANVFCNGIGSRFERTEFRNGDDLYMSVATPVDGYLAVYLSDGENVFCLLPYPDDSGHAIPIKGGTPKILFSYDHIDPGCSVKQYHMTTEKDYELNILYVVFSQNQFDKAIDNRSQLELPRQLPLSGFQKWLASCKRRDRQFQVKETTISITR